MEQVAGIAVADLGPTGLLALAVVLILFGALIPRPVHNRIIGMQDQRIEKLEELLDKRDRQIERMLPTAETAADALGKIQSVTEPDHPGGER